MGKRPQIKRTADKTAYAPQPHLCCRPHPVKEYMAVGGKDNNIGVISFGTGAYRCGKGAKVTLHLMAADVLTCGRVGVFACRDYCSRRFNGGLTEGGGAKMLTVTKESGGFVAVDITGLIDWSRHEVVLLLVAYGKTSAWFYGAKTDCAPYITVTGSGGGTADGVLNNIFTEDFIEVTASDLPLPAFDISTTEKLTFFVQNTGVPLLVNIEISPDGVTFIDDTEPVTLESGKMGYYVPYRFAKFMRLKLRASDPAGSVSAKVWRQAQTKNYILAQN